VFLPGYWSGEPTEHTLIGPIEAPRLHLATFNIRRRIPHVTKRSPDLWSRRRPSLREFLTGELPAVLGVQEALPDQALFISETLGHPYNRVGHGRSADESGEQCPVYYDSRRLRLEEWHQFALSATPSVPGSRSWGNFVPRIAVVARFTDLATSRQLRVINTHLDHLSRHSRLESARMLRGLVEADPTPTVLMGDANSGAGSAPHRALTNGGVLRDAWLVADRRLTPAFGTYTRYRSPVAGGKRIDWLLVGRSIHVESAGINAARYGGVAASDHAAVQAVVSL
jgi:endonuclease/exonuclease/phosphatase family metal-dependent hydrolase